MNVVTLEHVPYEDPGELLPWLQDRGHEIRRVPLYHGALLPECRQFDWLIIMGGPMSVHDEHLYSWLRHEKKLIREALAANKRILGICLGAQLIASVMGADVTPADEPEIGWWPVRRTENGPFHSDLSRMFPRKFTAFHWHGEHFAIPEGADHLLKSDGCENQAFAVGNRVLGLQFHLETTQEGVSQLARHCGPELGCPGQWVQNEKKLAQPSAQVLEDARSILYNVMFQMEVH